MDGGSTAGTPRLSLTQRAVATVAAPAVCHDEHRPPVAHDSCQLAPGVEEPGKEHERDTETGPALCVYPFSGVSRLPFYRPNRTSASRPYEDRRFPA